MVHYEMSPYNLYEILTGFLFLVNSLAASIGQK